MMKIKMVGFKVGLSRPTTNITFKVKKYELLEWDLGKRLLKILEKSDFVSIRKID